MLSTETRAYRPARKRPGNRVRTGAGSDRGRPGSDLWSGQAADGEAVKPNHLGKQRDIMDKIYAADTMTTICSVPPPPPHTYYIWYRYVICIVVSGIAHFLRVIFSAIKTASLTHIRLASPSFCVKNAPETDLARPAFGANSFRRGIGEWYFINGHTQIQMRKHSKLADKLCRFRFNVYF
jgi:hypothetical protein